MSWRYFRDPFTLGTVTILGLATEVAVFGFRFLSTVTTFFTLTTTLNYNDRQLAGLFGVGSSQFLSM